MNKNKHKVFISYHHKNDQGYKQKLLQLNDKYDLFIDASVDTGDIDDNLEDDVIREKVRDEYLRDSTVTLLLAGTETERRKHVDWELYSSMQDGKKNKKSGVLVVNLPSTGCENYTAAHGNQEKEAVYPECQSWTKFTSRKDHEERYPHMPERIIDNLLAPEAYISVVPWEKIYREPESLRLLIELTHRDREKCKYALGRRMRRANS